MSIGGGLTPRLLVEAKDLSKNFDLGNRKLVVLDSVSFQIFEGEFVVILGPSGAGKSTLLNIIGGLDRPSGGTLIVDDNVLTDLDEQALASFRSTNVGFIFQTYNLISTLTALENVQFPMKLAGCEDDSGITAKSEKLLSLVGLLQRADHLPFQLSCGEQQRVAIARALANEPKLILADEPTGNLDWETGFEIVKLLKNLSEEKQKTLVIATHDERMVELSDVTMRIVNGRLNFDARST